MCPHKRTRTYAHTRFPSCETTPLWPQIKDRAETIENDALVEQIDECIAIWTRSALTQNEHDSHIARNVHRMQVSTRVRAPAHKATPPLRRDMDMCHAFSE